MNQVYVVIQYTEILGIEVKEIEMVVDSVEKANAALHGFKQLNPKGKFKYENYNVL